MTEPINPPEFYAARDAVMNGAYIQMRTGILRRYINVLRKHRPWESIPECAATAMMKAEWLAKLKHEIEVRKEKRRKVAADITKKVAAGLIVAGIIALMTWVFSFWPFGA